METDALLDDATRLQAREPRDDFVLVGFAPDTARVVLDAASDAATTLGRDVVLLSVTPDPSFASEGTAAAVGLAAAHVRSRTGSGVHVLVRARVGPTVETLVDASRGAGLLVLGSQHDEGLGEVVHRDVIAHVAARAACPVLVVHPLHEPSRRGASELITVGMDQHDSDSALIAGFAIAQLTEHRLRVVRTWWPATAATVAATQRTTDLRDGLTRRVDAVAASYPGVQVTVLVWRERPGEALLTASRGSSLVILSRDPDGAGGAGSVSPVVRSVLREARCPVLVT